MRMTRQGAFPMALTLLLALVGCGEESDSGGGSTDGDGGAATGGETGGETGSGSGGSGGETGGETGSGSGGSGGDGLADDTAGKECASDDDCGAGGTCVAELTFGNLAMGALEPVPAPGGYCSATCASDDDCGAGGVCFGAIPVVGGGECRSGCESDADCRSGYECAMLNQDIDVPVANSCQPVPVADQLGDDEAGALCSSDADCPGGRCADDGVCTGRCTEDSHCGAGGVCEPGPYGSLGSCAEGCATTADCQNAAQDYRCSAGDPQVCVLRLAEGRVGEPCTEATEDVDCPGGSCRERAFNTDYEGGYCVGDCDVDADCGGGGVCINESTCLKGCSGNADCRTNYECVVHPLADANTTGTICYPMTPANTGDAGP